MSSLPEVIPEGAKIVADLTQGRSAAVSEMAGDTVKDDHSIALVGQLRVNGSSSPVYAVRSDRSKRDSLLHQFLFRIGWACGRRFWPCAELDNPW
jgi:hypothetical protein